MTLVLLHWGKGATWAKSGILTITKYSFRQFDHLFLLRWVASGVRHYKFKCILWIPPLELIYRNANHFWGRYLFLVHQKPSVATFQSCWNDILIKEPTGGLLKSQSFFFFNFENTWWKNVYDVTGREWRLVCRRASLSDHWWNWLSITF